MKLLLKLLRLAFTPSSFLSAACQREVGEKFTIHSSAALGLLASLISLLTGLIDVC